MLLTSRSAYVIHRLSYVLRAYAPPRSRPIRGGAFSRARLIVGPAGACPLSPAVVEYRR
ncbi:hypothetical protein HMPREF0372_02426 [Flavonifractor plautii ATCC 29863]|uniref:Uncharacterized protein n=1 Tax=Flavonifractor plautii ATCC 29863 TaxID=411475 RepID=G9YSE8_FLAPL|nr:hypothetical protein HMPREF0372_02426 [Flavonifractor plautii ATCC 29863]